MSQSDKLSTTSVQGSGNSHGVSRRSRNEHILSGQRQRTYLYNTEHSYSLHRTHSLRSSDPAVVVTMAESNMQHKIDAFTQSFEPQMKTNDEQANT
ncbi:hypothetical protein BPAE_0174g00010 [Botrytis paeoniae]|uniref:Uncharacterized protein n=1 Tax=Botrytis paeoniae TaxID=278948 RepID=A0A4Z1FFF7_9HELO|nr:hypothetical protein BPAE_0174g00010 [Botrytis paeoniae]